MGNKSLLENYTLEPLGQTQPFIFGKKKKELEVFYIPLKYLKYNKKNGRIFLGINEKEKSGVDLDQMTQDEFNEEVESIIWNYDLDKNKKTYSSIKEYEQLEIALVSDQGIVIDGNRRFTCLRRLNRDFPDDERYKYLKASIVGVGDEIDSKDIKKYELNVQFGKEEKADYHVTDRVMSIYEEVNEKILTIEEIAEQMNISKSKVDDHIRTAEIIIDFLKHLNIPDQFYVVDKLDLVNPLAELGKLFKSNKYIGHLSESEKAARKEIFYHLAIGMSYSLPTQHLRDNLIKNIYKNKDKDLSYEFVSEYDEKVSPLVHEYISKEMDIEELSTLKKKFKESIAGQEMNKLYGKYIDKAGLSRTIQGQLELVEKAQNALNEVDLSLFVELDDETSQDIHKKIIESLYEMKKIIGELVCDDDE